MSNEIRTIIVGGSVITSLIGLFFVIKIWMVWKHVNKEILKARVFLNRNFLEKNWVCVFMAGAFIAVRRVVQLLELLGFPMTNTVAILFDIMGLAVIILLVLLAYYWYRLIYSTIEVRQISH